MSINFEFDQNAFRSAVTKIAHEGAAKITNRTQVEFDRVFDARNGKSLETLGHEIEAVFSGNGGSIGRDEAIQYAQAMFDGHRVVLKLQII